MPQMMDDARGATVAKRRLSRILADMRVESGYTANHVCDILNWGRGKVGRFEANQWKRPEMSDIRDLLRIYGVVGEKRMEVENLAIRARARPWWRDYGDVFDNEFPGFEADAAEIRVFMPLVVPGLLQTPAYIDALLRVGPRPLAWRRRALEARLRRQQVLDREDGTAPGLIAVITEASLMYRWSTRVERCEQVAHLVEMSRRPDVELRIQRFVDGPPTGMLSMIDIFDFTGGEPSAVFVEAELTIQEVTSKEQVKTYSQAFDRARDAAVEPAETTTYLEQLIEKLE
ncbi:MAG TPA: helix-turn-helix transcriptional regulator [Streptosporangiaceae bacterium]|nr:helix-turn-helix transcriptional regulator [Streptosporangiaceae bacterium]